MARILIVDDSAIMRNLLSDYLSDIGHDSITCGTGDEAITAMKTGHVDLCVCDLHLPRLSGYDLYKTLSAIQPNLKVIFTDSLPDRISEQVISEGYYSYLKKPFELTQLQNMLDKTLTPIRQR